MSTEKTKENVREAALRLCLEEEKKRKTDPYETRERSVIIVGGKGVGKTTMVYRFLEREDAPKPTIAMDYSFGRKAGKSLVKNIVHFWEVGHLSSSLVAAAMSGSCLTHSPHHTTVLMMLDLSRPETLWSSFEEGLATIRSGLEASQREETIRELREHRFKGMKKESEQGVDPFPMRLCIVGGKYDEFKEFDGDRRELIGGTLRTIAHILGAALHYHSSKDKALLRKTKDVLSHYGFGTPFPETKHIDYDKPLTISAGADSFESIDLRFSETTALPSLDGIKQIYISRIPQVSTTTDEEATRDDPINDPKFNEPMIDRLRAQRQEEIDVLIENMLEGPVPEIPIPDPI